MASRLEQASNKAVRARDRFFALSLDPFLRYVCSILPRPIAVIAAFADDLAAVLKDFYVHLPLLLDALRLLWQAAHLKPSIRKTQLVPLFKHEVRALRD